MEIKNVTFIGLGVMGYNMAGHLKKNNYNTTVYNRTNSVADKFSSFPNFVEPTPAITISCINLSRSGNTLQTASLRLSQN